MPMTLDLDPALMARAEKQAAREGTTLSLYVERLLQEQGPQRVFAVPTRPDEALAFIEVLPPREKRE